MSDTPKRPPTAQEFVLEQLRKAIVTRQLLPGAPIRQELLAEKYGTSRVPLREALKILEGEGQVTYVPHRGYFVAELSIADLKEVYEIRELLESKALDAAARLVQPEEIVRIAGIHALLDETTAAGDIPRMTELNRQFHFAIFNVSAMPRLVRMIQFLWDSTDAYRSVYYGEAPNRDRVRAEHSEMMRALEAKDARHLTALHREHRSHAIAALNEILQA